MRDMICDFCKNKKFSSKSGLICGLTMDKPNVRYTCDFYDKDELLEQRFQREDEHREDAEFRDNEFNVDGGLFSFWSNVLIYFRNRREK